MCWLYTILDWILVCNMGHRACKSFLSCAAKALSQQKLIKIAWQLVSMTSLHFLYLVLGPSPVWLNVLCMDACCRVNEVKAMVDSTVRLPTWQYAALLSEWMVVPEAVWVWIMGNNVAASHLWTTSMCPRAGSWDVSTIPNTHGSWCVGDLYCTVNVKNYIDITLLHVLY